MRTEYRYAIPATDKDGKPVNELFADTLAEAKRTARQLLTEWEDVTLVEVIAQDSGDCVWDLRRKS